MRDSVAADALVRRASSLLDAALEGRLEIVTSTAR